MMRPEKDRAECTGQAGRCAATLRRDDDMILSKFRRYAEFVHSAANCRRVITPRQLVGLHSQNEEARAYICQLCQVATERLVFLIVARRPSPRTDSAFGVRRQTFSLKSRQDPMTGPSVMRYPKRTRMPSPKHPRHPRSPGTREQSMAAVRISTLSDDER